MEKKKKLVSENKLQQVAMALITFLLLWEKQAILLTAACICTNKTTKHTLHFLHRGLDSLEPSVQRKDIKENQLVVSRTSGSYR